MISPYVRSIGRLVADLQAGAGNEAIGNSLAAVLRQVRPRTAQLRVEGEQLLLDGHLVPETDGAEVETLRLAMTRQELSGLELQMGVTAREVLQLTALLAVSESASDQTTIFDAARRLGFWHITLQGEAAAPVARPAAAIDASTPTVGSLADAERLAEEYHTELADALAGSQATQVATVLARVTRLEHAAVTAAAANPSDEATAIAARWSQCFTHLCTPPALRLVAGLVITESFPHDTLVAILARAGHAGTATLMQYLTAAASLMHRRVLFDTIVELGSGVPVLIANLEHKLWFVVRNAACLLGALRATEAEPALIATLSHADERVRTSSATALAQMGTQTGRRALENAIRDSSSEVRRRALRGLLHGDGLTRSAAVLSEAVDLERDPEVQLEVIAALREIGTPSAVQQLVKMCSPSTSAGKSFEFRRAAMDALVALRPSAAAPLLRIHAQDRDPVVRTYAQAMLEHVSRAA
jgi:hypothetical protein